MTTPNAGEVIAVPELSRPIWAVKSTLRTNSGQPSPFAGRMAHAAMQRPGCHDDHAQRHAPEGAPERRHAIDADADGDEIAAPENGDKNRESDAPRGERFDGSGGGAQVPIVAWPGII